MGASALASEEAMSTGATLLEPRAIPSIVALDPLRSSVGVSASATRTIHSALLCAEHGRLRIRHRCRGGGPRSSGLSFWGASWS